MNRYKIDANNYLSGEFKYALYVKRWLRWRHLESFKTVEEARKVWESLTALPIHL